jgi:protein-disulfide isomerase
VRAWREAPLQQIPVSTNAGTFGDYGKGQTQAPVQVVEFADFECPGCRMLCTALEPVLEKFKEHYHFVFKNFPLDSACNPGISGKFHQNSCFAAYFVHCAGEQGRFWEALDYAFTDPVLERDGEQSDSQVEEVRKTMIGDGAAALELDAQALRECITSGRYLARVREQVEQGATAGLTSTPSIWINGKRVEYPSPDAIEKIFSAILAERGIVVAETAGSK